MTTSTPTNNVEKNIVDRDITDGNILFSERLGSHGITAKTPLATLQKYFFVARGEASGKDKKIYTKYSPMKILAPGIVVPVQSLEMNISDITINGPHIPHFKAAPNGDYDVGPTKPGVNIYVPKTNPVFDLICQYEMLIKASYVFYASCYPSSGPGTHQKENQCENFSSDLLSFTCSKKEVKGEGGRGKEITVTAYFLSVVTKDGQIIDLNEYASLPQFNGTSKHAPEAEKFLDTLTKQMAKTIKSEGKILYYLDPEAFSPKVANDTGIYYTLDFRVPFGQNVRKTIAPSERKKELEREKNKTKTKEEIDKENEMKTAKFWEISIPLALRSGSKIVKLSAGDKEFDWFSFPKEVRNDKNPIWKQIRDKAIPTLEKLPLPGVISDGGQKISFKGCVKFNQSSVGIGGTKLSCKCHFQIIETLILAEPVFEKKNETDTEKFDIGNITDGEELVFSSSGNTEEPVQKTSVVADAAANLEEEG